MKNKLIIEICMALMLLLFTYASLTKFLDHRRFEFQLHLVPIDGIRMLAPVISWAVPFIEMLLVIGLLMERLRLKALVGSVILLFFFEIYISTMLLSGLNLPCTCGGVIAKLTWKQHMLFNAFFILTGLVGIYYSNYNVAGRINFREKP